MSARLFIIKCGLVILILLYTLTLGSYASGDVIFEDDFNNFTSGWVPSISGGGHHVVGGTIGNPGRGEPTGWTGWINHDVGNYITIVTGEGRDGSPSLKIGPNPNHSPWEQVGLVKYLGPTGYNKIYIRYFVKYDQNWRWGDGTNGSQNYHKWVRIWQNVSVEELLGDTGNLSSEKARGALLITTNDDEWADFSPYFNGTFLRNAVDDSLGSTANMYYYPWDDSITGGFIENHFGIIDSSGYWQEAQTWHCIEIHLKLASAFDGTDGVFELWVDGIKQKDPTRKARCTSMSTAKVGTGINYIGLHDNGTGNQFWPDYRYIWIDDVVISTSYIGPDYVIGPIEGPEIQVSPTSYDYGSVEVGSYSDWETLTISNLGAEVLAVSSVTPGNPDFTIVSPAFPQDINPGASLDLVVRFSPSSVGAINGNLTINSNDADEPSLNVSLSGTGIGQDTEPPVAEAGADKNVLAGVSVSFDGSGSSDNVGITSYEWDFDDSDGIQIDATGVTASHIYDTPGTYTVTLTVDDAAGNGPVSDTLTGTVEESVNIFSDVTSEVPNLNDAIHWTPHTPSRWAVISDENDHRYAIITSDYSNNGDMLGEYSIFNDFNDFTGNSFTLSLKAKSTEDLQSNTWADYDVIFGYQDDSNYYYVMFNANASANQLFKVVNGTRTEMASYDGALITDNLYHEIEIRRSGERIQVFFDGTEVISATDNTYETGKIGLGGFNDAADFDDIQIFIPPADVSAFEANPGNGHITLSWTNPTDSDFAGVMIRYRTDGTYPTSNTDGTAVPNGNGGKIPGQPNASGSYVHTGLDSNLTYYYSAFTYDTSWNYSDTAHASAKPLPPATPNQPPEIVSFTATPSSLNNPGETTIFNVSATDPDGDSLAYTINFGDGTANGSSSQVVHTYEAGAGEPPHIYTATVTVSDGHGHSVGQSLQVTVNDVPPAKPTNVSAD